MSDVYCVRAEYGKYTPHFIRGGYVAIGWDINRDLSRVMNVEQLAKIYSEERPRDRGIVAEQHIGQIARFLFDIRSGDYVITPSLNTEFIHFGLVDAAPAYYYGHGKDGCPFPHRKRVRWSTNPIKTEEFPESFQTSLRSLMTVFAVSQQQAFFETIRRNVFTKEDLKT